MEEYNYQNNSNNKMNYYVNNEDDTITVSIKNNINDKIDFFVNKLQKIELKIENILSSVNSLSKYNKQLEDSIVSINNKLIDKENIIKAYDLKFKIMEENILFICNKLNINTINSNTINSNTININTINKEYYNNIDNIKINNYINNKEDIDNIQNIQNIQNNPLFISESINFEINNKENSNIIDNEINSKKTTNKKNILKKYLEFGSNNNLNEMNIINETNNKKKIKEKDKKVIIDNYKEIKKEKYDLDIIFIKDCLDMNNIDGEIKIFKKVYMENISKQYYPIRNFRKKMQYWYNDNMNDDPNGNYIKNTILENIENCYLSVNNIDNYKNNIEQFLKNQEYIIKLCEQKYKDKFLNSIIDLIKI
jgi:hypothetical protein